MNKTVNKTKKIAVAGILTALAVLLLFIGSILDVLDLASAAMGTLVILVAMIELGNSWALGVYAAASVISLLILPHKLPALVFAAFSGYYPVLKKPLNKIKPKFLSYITRIAIFNVFFFLSYFIATKLFGEVFEYEFLSYIFAILANVTFVIFDLAIERLAVFYTVKIKPKFDKR